jgi:hypothetical protein
LSLLSTSVTSRWTLSLKKKVIKTGVNCLHHQVYFKYIKTVLRRHLEEKKEKKWEFALTQPNPCFVLPCWTK